MVHPIPSSDADRTAEAIPSTDALYRVLSARRRREALQQLNEAEDEIGLADLAGRIALREASSDDDPDSTADARRIHLSLHHIHVPKLAAANAVEFDRTERTVALTETGRAIVAELDRFANRRE